MISRYIRIEIMWNNVLRELLLTSIAIFSILILLALAYYRGVSYDANVKGEFLEIVETKGMDVAKAWLDEFYWLTEYDRFDIKYASNKVLEDMWVQFKMGNHFKARKNAYMLLEYGEHEHRFSAYFVIAETLSTSDNLTLALYKALDDPRADQDLRFMALMAISRSMDDPFHAWTYEHKAPMLVLDIDQQKISELGYSWALEKLTG